MKDLKCPYCGADLKADESAKEIVCDYCDSKVPVSSAAESGSAAATAETATTTATTAAPAASEASGTTEKRRSHLLLWILGWIFLWPLPVTILVHRSKMPKLVKGLIIAAVWIIYAGGGFSLRDYLPF